jgi:hypothetical protein
LLEETPGLAVSALESALKRSPDRVTDTTNNLTFARLNCRVSLEGLFVDGFESGH